VFAKIFISVMQLHDLPVHWKTVFLLWWFRKCERSRYCRQTTNWYPGGWACLARCGWMLAIVGNAGLLLLEATHISPATGNENIQHSSGV